VWDKFVVVVHISPRGSPNDEAGRCLLSLVLQLRRSSRWLPTTSASPADEPLAGEWVRGSTPESSLRSHSPAAAGGSAKQPRFLRLVTSTGSDCIWPVGWRST